MRSPREPGGSTDGRAGSPSRVARRLRRSRHRARRPGHARGLGLCRSARRRARPVGNRPRHARRPFRPARSGDVRIVRAQSWPRQAGPGLSGRRGGGSPRCRAQHRPFQRRSRGAVRGPPLRHRVRRGRAGGHLHAAACGRAVAGRAVGGGGRRAGRRRPRDAVRVLRHRGGRPGDAAGAADHPPAARRHRAQRRGGVVLRRLRPHPVHQRRLPPGVFSLSATRTPAAHDA